MGSQIYSRLAEGRSRRAEPAGFTDAESAGYRDAESAGPPVEPAMAVRSAAEPPGQPEAATLSVELSARGQSAARRVAESPGAQPPDVRQRVMMLYRAGFSPSLIASRVGAPMGEVELIISLEQRKGLA